MKKFISTYGQDIAHKHRFIEEPESLIFSEGISSLIPHTPSDTAQFPVMAGKTIIPGMKTGKDLKTLNLINSEDKIYAALSPSIFHFVAEDFLNVLSFAILSNKYKGLEVIIDISAIWGSLHDGPKFDIFWFYLKTLKDNGVRHRLINASKFDVIYIDNFYLLPNVLTTPMDKYLFLNEYLLQYLENPNVEPYRNVYVSRKKYDHPTTAMVNLPDLGETEIYSDRIDDESVVEQYFIDLGFEIVYPEDFDKFEDQLNYFASVKTMASITSAGMTNQIYMKPGGNVIEIVTPLIAVPVNGAGEAGYVNAEFHNYYKNMAMSLGHSYTAIPNLNGRASEFKSLVESNKTFSNIIRGIVS